MRSTKLALDKSEAQSLFFSVRFHRAACLAASEGFGAKPQFVLILSINLYKYGGALRHPPILTKSVDFIDKCLLFIFFKKFLDIFFFVC